MTDNLNQQPQVASEQPMAAQGAPAPQEQTLTFRVHKAYIWLSALQAGLAFIIVFFFSSIGSVFSALDANDPSELLGATIFSFALIFFIVVVFGICILAQVFSYKHLMYSVGPAEFTLYKGIFNKQQIHVPYARVQSVDKRATLTQRIFGLCSVYIDTAGGESNKAIIVPYLAKAQADWLISQLYARKMNAVQPQAQPAYQAPVAQTPQSAAVAAPQPQATAPVAQQSQPAAGPQSQAAATAQPGQQQNGNILDVGTEAWNQFGGVFAGQPAVTFDTVSYEYGLSNKELFLSGLSNNASFAAIVIIVICFVVQAVGFLCEVFPLQANSVAGTLSTFDLSGALSSFALPLVGTIAVAVIGIFVFIWLLSALAACLNFGGFRARRYTDRIEVQHGLLQHTSMSVSIERIQAVVVKQTFIRRLIGYCEISLDKVDAVAPNTSSNEAKSLNSHGLVVHPFVKVAKVPEILAGLLPEYADAPAQETPVARVALRRAIIRRCIWQSGGFWLAVLTLMAQIILNAFLGQDLQAAAVVGELQVALSDTAPTGSDYAMLADIAQSYAEAQFALGIINLCAVVLYIIAAVTIIVDLLAAILWARGSGFAYNRRFMRITNSGLAKETRTLPKQKIQFGFTRTNPFQRMANTATINISTAAGMGSQDSLIDVEKGEALRWLEWVKPYQ